MDRFTALQTATAGWTQDLTPSTPTSVELTLSILSSFLHKGHILNVKCFLSCLQPGYFRNSTQTECARKLQLKLTMFSSSFFYFETREKGLKSILKVESKNMCFVQHGDMNVPPVCQHQTRHTIIIIIGLQYPCCFYWGCVQVLLMINFVIMEPGL